MNNFKKITAVLLAVIMVISVAGCSRTPSWSYKTENHTYADGVYIYSLFSAYNEAYSILQSQQGDKFDANASILDIKSTFDEEDGEVLCRDWIIQQADIITKNLAALDADIDKYNITLDTVQVDSAKELAKEDWYLGPYYEYYVASGYNAVSYKSTLEPYGVSFDSFLTSTYLASVKQNSIFDYMYDKGGIKEVPEEEIVEYFESNYTSYAYFTVNLYDTAIDETTGQQKAVAFSDDLINGVKKSLDKYSKLINSGTPYSEVMYRYMKDNNITDDPSVKNVENLAGSSLGDSVLKALNDLKPGKSTYIQVGTGETAVMYFIAKFDIKDSTQEYLSAESNRSSLLQNMKSDEFVEYLDEITNSISCEVNPDALKNYTPEMFEENL